MSRYGYFLSAEEYSPPELVSQARMAEQAGFEALWISDAPAAPPGGAGPEQQLLPVPASLA